MGCDIHCHAEVKINGKWEHYSTPQFERNYRIFEKMAGVRGDEENAISAPKGLPEDCSVVTMLDSRRWGADGHSHSWLSADEIRQLSEWSRVTHERYLAEVGPLSVW